MSDNLVQPSSDLKATAVCVALQIFSRIEWPQKPEDAKKRAEQIGEAAKAIWLKMQ